MTRYQIYCPICGKEAYARVTGEPTDLRDGLQSHDIDGFYYIHDENDVFGDNNES